MKNKSQKVLLKSANAAFDTWQTALKTSGGELDGKAWAAEMRLCAILKTIARNAGSFNDAFAALELTPERSRAEKFALWRCARLVSTPTQYRRLVELDLDCGGLLMGSLGRTSDRLDAKARSLWCDGIRQASSVKELIAAYYDPRLGCMISDDTLEPPIVAKGLKMATTAREVARIWRHVVYSEDESLCGDVLKRWKQLATAANIRRSIRRIEKRDAEAYSRMFRHNVLAVGVVVPNP